MRLAIISPEKGWQNEQLKKAAEKRGWEVSFLHPRRFSVSLPNITIENNDLSVYKYDAFLVRNIPFGSLEQIVFRLDVLYTIEETGAMVVNSAFTIEKTVDKLYSSLLLSKNGISTPKTIVAERFVDAMRFFRELGGDVVIKPLFGSNGIGIMRINSEDMAYRIFKALQLARYTFYIQEFIPHNCQDIRVFLIKGKIVSAMIRKGNSWKTNIHQGAEPKFYKVSDDIEVLCLKVGKLFKADYLGIDIVISEYGDLYVIEANGIPGWRGLQSVTKENIANTILQCFERKKGC